MWRPRRVFWEEQGKWKAYAPKNSVQDIMKKSKIILMSNALSTKEKKGIRRFCKDFDIFTPINESEFCPFCLLHDRITLLQPEKIFLVYNRKVCKVCAFQELEKELKAKKVNLLGSPGFRKYSLSLLTRLHDVTKVQSVLMNGESSIGELTLVKKIEEISKSKMKQLYQKVEEFKLPTFLSNSLKSRNISSFLPIQVKAIQKGLLKNQNQLIIANTSAGKTLIGEIAGISHLLKQKKFIFTVPLVALANTKFDDFKKNYSSKFKVSLRTGRSRVFKSLKEKKAFFRERFSIKDANIIVATYEGLDLLIRGGQINFDEIGCIVVDEVQTLADPDRGATLDCLLAKIRIFARQAQVIALSATVGNPTEFAEYLSLTLVTFNLRPIPLEQHILISRSDEEKMRQIYKLSRKEFRLTSKSGFHGQTIVFTNSRRKTIEISDYLNSTGIKNAHAYHSGISYNLRRRIESKFSSGQCSIIVSTFALGAGVDFPASQVIFESLMMGNKVLEPNNFTQMVGRAGRLGKHDRGRVVLLCKGESISSFETRTEIEIAFELIKAELLPIEPNHDENSCAEQILSICSSKKDVTPKRAKEIYQKMIGTANFDFMYIANNLIKNSLLKVNTETRTRKLMLTSLGQAATLSFFSPEKVLNIKSLLSQKRHFLQIALEEYPLTNIYLSKKLHTYLEKTYHMRFSTRLINSPVLDVMSASLKGKESTELNKWCLTIFSRWVQNFFICQCQENPFCTHGQEQIGRYLVTERLNGKNISQISTKLSSFELQVYPGDVLSFLNSIIHELEGIQRIAEVLYGKNGKMSKKMSSLITRLEVPDIKAPVFDD
jgi:helicase